MKIKSTKRKSAALALLAAVTFGLGTTSSAWAQKAPPPQLPPRQMENLGRGVVAINQGNGKVFVGWRMLGTDPDEIAFNVYRTIGNGQPTKVNAAPITKNTEFADQNVNFTQAVSYSVRPVLGGKEQEPSKPFTFKAGAEAKAYLSIPLKTPQGYSAGDCSAADLDGDGEYEIVVHMNGRGKDNSQKGETDPPILQAYKLDGTMLWEINLGHNIREGAHYTQFQVFDFDGDGRAELICKTADGTTDAKGKIVGDAKVRYANEGGYVLKGPEFISVFDGLTGELKDTKPYWPQRFPDKDDPTGDEMKAYWGDGYGNRLDRFLAGTAYLDGVHPTAIFSRGYYTHTFIAAWDYKDGKLVQRWLFDSEDPKSVGENPSAVNDDHYKGKPFSGQGNHQLSIADVDGDGKDEVVFGGMTVDDNGKGLYTTGWGHGDAMHVGDLDPDHPGLEVFRIQERFDDAGAHMFDAKTGKVLWKKASKAAATTGGDKGEGPGRGACFNIDPRYSGSESWSAGAGIEGVWDAKGNEIGNVKPGSCNFRIYWDGDLLDELLDKNHVDKWNWETQKTERIFTAEGCTSNNGTKATPCLSADLLGDWREEVMFRTEDSSELRIYTTTIPTDHRLYTLMHDPQYRLAVAWQNTAYNQPPHVSFYTDEKMPAPPKPNIVLVKSKTPQGQASR